jgi:hypothetical protein
VGCDVRAGSKHGTEMHFRGSKNDHTMHRVLFNSHRKELRALFLLIFGPPSPPSYCQAPSYGSSGTNHDWVLCTGEGGKAEKAKPMVHNTVLFAGLRFKDAFSNLVL